jgi:hypothetical protein
MLILLAVIQLEYPGAEAFYLYSLAEQIVKRTEPDQFDTNEYEQVSPYILVHALYYHCVFQSFAFARL